MHNGFRRPLLLFAIVAIIVALPINPVAAEDSSKRAEPPRRTEAQKVCMSYEPGEVALKGHLRRSPTDLVLELSDPICINQREKEESLYPFVRNVKTILFLKQGDDRPDKYLYLKQEDDRPDKYSEFLDKDVLVIGTLYHKYGDSDTGSIIIRVSHIEMATRS